MTVREPGVAGYLGRALSLEMAMVQQYLSHARLASHWGMDRAAQWLRGEAQGEMEHADRITGRLLALGMVPGASVLRPVTPVEDFGALLQANRDREREIVAFYEGAVTYCRRLGDADGGAFFNDLLAEERQHLSEVEAWFSAHTEDGTSRSQRRR